jgi:hypothetical protein
MARTNTKTLAVLAILSIVPLSGCSLSQQSTTKTTEEFTRLHEQQPIPFNAQQWKAANGNADHGIRQKMTTDLLKQHKLIGLTQDQLVELLGPLERGAWALADDESGYLLNQNDPGGEMWLKLKIKNGVVSTESIENFNP